jgi:site-specific recombinase XerD
VEFLACLLWLKIHVGTVAVLLGHSSIDCSQRYVDVDPATLEAMFEHAIADKL